MNAGADNGFVSASGRGAAGPYRGSLFAAYAILLALNLALVGAIAWEGTAVLETAMGLVGTELPALKSLSELKVAVVDEKPGFYEHYVTRNRDKFVERHRYNRSRIEEGLRTAKARFPQHGLVPVIEGQYAEIVDKAARLEASLASGVSPEEAPRLIRELGQVCGEINQNVDRLVRELQNHVTAAGEHGQAKVSALSGPWCWSSLAAIGAMGLSGRPANTRLPRALSSGPGGDPRLSRGHHRGEAGGGATAVPRLSRRIDRTTQPPPVRTGGAGRGGGTGPCRLRSGAARER
jgi:hypothetical protein